MPEASIRFLRVRGIPIGAHWSWFFVAALLSWSLVTQFFPRSYPGLSARDYVWMGVGATVLFFVSILLHELGHAFRALKEGMRIEGISLWLFGGVARFTGMFPSAGAEFRIAIAGPAVSVVLAAAFGGLALVGGRMGWSDAVVGVPRYLGEINLILVAFNMVPALPLDGGRVFRAWLWHRRKDFAAATAVAAKAGRGFGFFLVAVGLLGLFSNAATGGIWFVFLGWFLIQAANAEAGSVLLHRAFDRVQVRDLMTPDPVAVTPGLPVSELLEGTPARRRYTTYPVVDDGRPVGLVSLRQAAAVAPDERARATVGDIALTGEAAPTVTPETGVLDALAVLQRAPGRALVVDGGRLAGIISTSDLAGALEFEAARAAHEPPRRGAGGRAPLVVFVLLAVALAALYRPPVAVVAPGEAVDLTDHIAITGVEVDRPNGRYLLTSVRLARPTGLGLLVAAVHPRQDVVPLSAFVPEGADPEEFVRRQEELFRQSRQLAAVAAARAAGLEASASGRGARVASVVEGSPASRFLRPGDVIVAVDGSVVTELDDVRDAVAMVPVGTRVGLSVRRDGNTVDLRVPTARFRQAGEEVLGIGVVLETADLDVRLPFDIEFREVPIGGPSSGLAYALAIFDMLDPADTATGRRVAATGTIDARGNVGPVGAVREKATGARAAGAEVFLVPSMEVEAVDDPALEVRGVRTLDEAVRFLSRLAPG